MNEQELEERVLKKTEEAYTVINSMAEDNTAALDYFRELHNFYTQPKSREIYLRTFKYFYFGNTEENILRYENDLEGYSWQEKNIKKSYAANVVGSLGFLGGAIISKIWPLAIPSLFFVRDIIRTYNYSNELKKEKQSTLDSLKKAKEKKEEMDKKS
jgi:hypothetical protein